MMARNLYPLAHMTTGQILLFVILFFAALIPSIFILRRMGFSGWWAIIAPISPLNLIGLWVLAFKRWPVEGRTPG